MTQSGQVNIRSFRRLLARKSLQALARMAPNQFAKRVERPCFLIACPRSGTSVFDQLLATNANVVCYPSEALEVWHPQAFPWVKYAARSDFPPIWADPEGFTQYSQSHRGKAFARHVRATFGAAVALSGGRQFALKSTMIGHLLPEVAQLFPHAHFVHIVRDGRAVALSWAKRQRLEIEQFPRVSKMRNYDDSLDDLLWKCGRSWSQIVDKIDADLELLNVGPDRWLEIHYEDFCQNPKGQLDRLARFLKLPTEGFDQRLLANVRSQNGKFRQQLDVRAQERLLSVTRETLARKGYLTGDRP